MKTTEKFTNGLSIIQLEERYEMAATGRVRDGDLQLPTYDLEGYTP